MSPPVPETVPSINTRTALVVDDFPSVQHYHSLVLKNVGFHCKVAQNGHEALALLRAHAVDLVMLDLVMPEMTGQEFLQHLHADSSLAHIPVLVISSESIGERIRRARTATSGPVGFVRKPLLPATIRAEVEALLR